MCVMGAACEVWCKRCSSLGQAEKSPGSEAMVTSPSSRAFCQTTAAGGKSLPTCVRWETTTTAIKWLSISLISREQEEFPGET